MTRAPAVTWPDGRAFAFTVFDDTDRATVANVSPVYAFLADLGLRTTKSVWTMRVEDRDGEYGATCEERPYRSWVESLAEQGFEIASHNVAARTCAREQTIEGLRRFRDCFGTTPSAHANHSRALQNIYWGEDRLSGPGHRRVYRALNLPRPLRFSGHVEGSPLFWGDVCREQVRYVRNFVHSEIDTLAFCPEMPYHDPHRPYVNAWFASTDGANVDRFVAALSEPALDRLESRGGACIMYTHFALGFARDGRLDPRFAATMRRLSERNGWFVPVSTLLDHLRAAKGDHMLRDDERERLERRWILDRLRHRGT